tara:strand:- start:1792 stop:3072 length:1281 start_codon:yes stop_codon:yes gene_type:complete
MADDFNLLNSDKFLDPPEVEISEEAIKGLTAASATALTATALLAGAKRGVGSLLDTQGYGVNSPVPKYETKVGKFSQIWNNALQASGATTRRGAVKEIAKSVVTGNPLELAASESSIKEVEKLLKNKNLSASKRANLELELKSRKKNINQRQGLLFNHKRSLGQNVNFNVPSDYKASTFVVDEQVARLDPSMKNKIGQTVEATEHVGKQQKLFKSYASNDPRVSYVTKVMKTGNLKKAKEAADKAHYLRNKRLVKPKTITNKLGQVIPVNSKDEQMGMKLWKMNEKTSYKGKLKPIYRLQFTPKLRQGLSSKLDYVVGQHWQYMDFVKTNGGYSKFRGGMRDIHNLTPHKYGQLAAKAESTFIGKPIVNYSDWKYKIMKKKRKKSTRTKWSKPTWLTSASRVLAKYGKLPAARIAKAVVTRGRSLV